ncbi:hypothetical protein BBK14_02050 [Parafrankia soli]|uniref:Uncharacterized protein n=1 Tax=Parafrankia soli TaxID=2599596 RepID=A0A1S1RIU4_9ACTN|nr:hypothetical protein BBK14_02050 [Parafrankia soli]
MKSWILVGGAFALVVVVVIAGVILAGGGDAGGTSSTPPRLAALMDRTGCQGKVDTEQFFVLEAVSCKTTDGSYRSIATFANRADRDAWVGFVKGSGYPVEHGELWAVSGTDQGAVRAYADAIG